MKKIKKASEYKNWVDLAKEIVRLRDKEKKKIHTIANMLELPERRVIFLARVFDKAMED